MGAYDYISWEAFHQDVDTLAEKLKALGTWERLVVIARGGLAPAAYLSQCLDIRLVETVCLASYFSENSQSRLEVLTEVADKDLKTLVIDDLVDSGTTLKFLRQTLPSAHCAVVYAKPKGLDQVDTFARQVAQDKWLVFPWEEKPLSSQENLA